MYHNSYTGIGIKVGEELMFVDCSYDPLTIHHSRIFQLLFRFGFNCTSCPLLRGSQGTLYGISFSLRPHRPFCASCVPEMQTMKFACRRKSTSQTISILRFSCQVHPSAKKNNKDQYRSLNDPSKFPFGLADCIPQMCWQHMSELSLCTAQARSLPFLHPPKKTTKPTASTGLFLHEWEKNPPDFPTRHRQQTPTDPVRRVSIPGRPGAS